MPLFTRSDRERSGPAGVALGLVALMFGFFAFVVAAHADNRKIGAPAGAVQVTLTEFAITPASISAPLNGKLTVTNSGSVVHNFNMQGTSVHTKDLQPGETRDRRPEGREGRAATPCSARSRATSSRHAGDARHRRSAAASSASAGMANMDFNSMSPAAAAAMNDQMDAAMAKAVDVYVAQLKNGPNTKGVGNQPLDADRCSPDGTKEFHLTAELANWEVSPGKTVRAWTFNGTVPGPSIKVNVGDKVQGRRRQQAADVDRRALPRHRGAVQHGRRPRHHAGADQARSELHVRVHGEQARARHVPLAPRRAGAGAERHARHLPGRRPALPPNTGPVTQDVPMVLNDAGVDRPVAQRQVVPGDRADHRPRR